MGVGRDPGGLQRLVGFGGAITSIIVAGVNFGQVHWYHGLSVLRSLGHYYVWSIILFAILFAVTGFWQSKAGAAVHVLVFFITAFLAARTALPGDVTSAIYLILGVLLLFEYRFTTSVTAIGVTVGVLTYPIGLAIGYSRSTGEAGASTGQALVLILYLVICFGAVFWRRILLQREEAALLEQRVEERTRELKTALDERSVMLQELHHRVRNNLQMIATLLQMEAKKSADPVLKTSTDTSVQRIHAMALVHETLYQSRPLHAIRLDQYVEKLARQIQLASTDRVKIEVDCEPEKLTTPDFALPFGLIVNELVSNACKHGFPAGRGGSITVRLRESKGLELSISDDGVGLPAGFDPASTTGVGLKIVRALVRQLSGKMTVVSNPERPGTRWELKFAVREGRYGVIRGESAQTPGLS
ncbi:MAG TPA: histidine kinase dimerization/phosphoacceptor domain -containing protein [Spirochaetia bacterium]|nr:histidine kinase dimerization/phosphoacceptor domain -containing protein [Spirochaetia bacterium]